MDKKNIQDKDLENVSGGNVIGPERRFCTCEGCQKKFDQRFAEVKHVNSGCMSDGTAYYKCPGCGKWVDSNGKVQG